MIGVVHIVWGPVGPPALRRFLGSYLDHAAGVEHELVFLFNGVGDADREELLACLGGVQAHVVELERPVLDLEAYVRAAALLDYDRLCFLNSQSEILADLWLARLNAALDEPGAGMVGATGSWASLRSAAQRLLLLPNPYGGTMPSRRVTRQQMYELQTELNRVRAGAMEPGEEPRSVTLRYSAGSFARALRMLPEQLLLFEPFPAYHLRTNAFMLERALFTSLRARPMRRKLDAYLLESGRHSFTRQVQRRGLRTLVVDRDGEAYDRDRWDQSDTLWQARQQGLMVADNQTRSYQEGGVERRRMLSAFAWGPRARAVG